MENVNTDVDKIWHYLGKFGKYQLIQSLHLTLGSVALASIMIGGMFTGKDVDFKCAKNLTSPYWTNSSVIVSQCRVKVIGNGSSRALEDESCSEFTYESGNRYKSYISEWDLVCDKEAVGHLAQILTMVGMGVGAFLLPPLGDRFGRKKLYIGSRLTLLVVMTSMAFVHSFEIFTFLKFISGAASQGQCVVEATLLLELYPVELRSSMGFVLVGNWILSYSVFVGAAWLLRGSDWRTLQLVYASFSVSILLQMWFVDESLQWLMGNGRVKKARNVMKKACKMNKKSFPNLISSVLAPNSTKQNDNDKGQHDGKETGQNLAENTQRVNGSLLDLLRTPGLRKITLIMGYTWCINSLTYYGLTLTTSSLFGDVYLNNFIAVLLELSSGVVMLYAVFRYGRKRTLIVFILLAGLCLCLTVMAFNLAPSTKGYLILQTALTQLGKCFISGSFNTIWLYTPEMYPTNIRNAGVGVSSACARFGSMFSPLFNLLVKEVPWVPGTIFSASCFLCAFLLMMLPETRWRELPMTIEEVEGWFIADQKTKEIKKLTQNETGEEELTLTQVGKNGEKCSSMKV